MAGALGRLKGKTMWCDWCDARINQATAYEIGCCVLCPECADEALKNRARRQTPLAPDRAGSADGDDGGDAAQ